MVYKENKSFLLSFDNDDDDHDDDDDDVVVENNINCINNKSIRKLSNKKAHLRKIILGAIRSKKFNLFTCTFCNNLLKHPVTVKCGHTLCMTCLKTSKQCKKCKLDATLTTEFDTESLRVNVLIQNLIEKWKEMNKICNLDNPMVNLEIYPRYLLRSRNAGIQYSVNMMMIKAPSIKRRKNQKKRIKLIKEHVHHPHKERSGGEASFQQIIDRMLKDLEGTIEKALRTSWTCISEEDLECLLCRQCFIDPVTTPCGHTFCRDCLTRVLDHRLTCPLCVSKLSVGDYLRGTTQILDQTIQILFPSSLSSATAEEKISSNFNSSFNVPVFICTNAFPGVACPLYVHEPRYRLLVRRCLTSIEKSFAMVSLELNDTKFMHFGTMLEVKDAVTLEDGRIILSTIGTRRFRVKKSIEKDGYDMAEIQYINDDELKPEELSNLVLLHRKVYARAIKWVKLLSPSALIEVERLIGKMPEVEENWFKLPDGPLWTWWLIPVLPLSPQFKAGFLSSTSLEKRLRAIDKMLEHLKVKMKAINNKEISDIYKKSEENIGFCMGEN